MTKVRHCSARKTVKLVSCVLVTLGTGNAALAMSEIVFMAMIFMPAGHVANESWTLNREFHSTIIIVFL